MNAIYRSADEAARLRWDRVHARRRDELDAVADAPAAYGRRVGRVAMGLVLCGAAAAMVVLAGIHASLSYYEQQAFNPRELLITSVLVFAWPAALLIGAVVRRLAERGCRARIEASLRPGADLYAAADRLDRESPADALRAAAMRLEAASVALPLAGVALLAPLTLHLPFAGLIGNSDLRYDGWIMMSMIVVGHAHFALVVCAIVFARRVRRHAGLEFSEDLRAFGWKSWGVAILVSALPGAALMLIPPILTAVTGLVFIPASFGAVARAALRERAEVGELDA